MLAAVSWSAGCGQRVTDVKCVVPAVSAAAPATHPAVLTTRPAPRTPPATVDFRSPRHHVAFRYLTSWHAVQDDTILTLVPAGEASLGSHTLAVDDPDLPFHIPGMIPLPAVANGFVTDLKGRYKDVLVEESSDRPAPAAIARFLRATGRGPRGAVEVVALLIVHGDHVYVIDAESDTAGAPAAREAFDTVIASLHWID